MNSSSGQLRFAAAEVDFDAVAAGLPGSIERVIGALELFTGRLTLDERRRTGGQRDSHVMTIVVKAGFGDPLDQAFTKLAGDVDVVLLKDDGKLLAGVPGDEIGLSRKRLHDHLLEIVRALQIALSLTARKFAAMGITRHDVRELWQPRRKRGAHRRQAGERQRTERGTVVAAPARIGESRGLLRHRLDNRAPAVSGGQVAGTRDAVDVSLPVLVEDVDPLATYENKVVVRGIAVEEGTSIAGTCQRFTCRFLEGVLALFHEG